MPKTLRGSFEQALRPLPCVVKGVQACRLPGLKCLKRCAAASSRHSGHCPLLLSAFKPATWLNARLWPQILRSFVLHDSIDWFRCENLSRKPYKHIITSYVYIYIYMYISAPLKGGRRHQGVSPFYIRTGTVSMTIVLTLILTMRLLFWIRIMTDSKTISFALYSRRGKSI